MNQCFGVDQNNISDNGSEPDMFVPLKKLIKWLSINSLTKYVITIGFTCILLFSTLVHVHGQTTALESQPFGVVLFAQGRGFTVFRGGEILTFSARTQEVLGTPLFQGDLIQTERETFLEIQILPGRDLIKISENTSFQIRSLLQDQGTSLELIYGRVRASVEPNAPRSFEIRGRSAVAGVRGTDFGFDYLVPTVAGSQPVTQVYAFEGSVSVTALTGTVGGALTRPSPEPVILQPNEMVLLQGQTIAADTVVVAQPIAREVTEFWVRNPIQTTPVTSEELNRRFPDLKIKILQSRTQALIDKERQALRAGQTTPEEFEQRVSELTLPEASLADRLRVLEPINASLILPDQNPRILVRNSARTIGGIFSGLGAFSAASAGIVMLWGDQFLNIPSGSVPGVSLGLLIGGVTGLTIGLTLYFLNLR